MDATRFERVKKLFLEARDMPPEKRAEFLRSACGGDADLRHEVESLLAQPSASLEIPGPWAPPSEQTEPAPVPHPLPERIGPYRILGLLGEGGMGAVYLAEQETPIRRKVALKSIRIGHDSPSVRARFESERQVLALMDHPNIARVLDAGSDERGHPYFVMELVQGIPITAHAAEHHASLQERLDLFRQVCRAVEDAHGKGIIHRDLKPSNILVVSHGERREVRIIDFGIAKATELAVERPAAAGLTEAGRLIGTLDYMSPEQTTGLPGQGDIRSDVYSLGIVLYELLAGAPPYRVGDLPLAEAIRVITTQVPRPIRHTPGGTGRLPDDLNVIVKKALEKDPTQRYATAAQFADDLDRFLRSEPILARPPSTAYQLRMLARRNKRTVAFLSAATLLLVVFATVVTFEAGAERRERLRAEKEAKRAEQVNTFLQNMFRSVNPGVKQLDVQVREVLDDAARWLDFGGMPDPEIEATLRRTIGNTYLELGEYGKASHELAQALDLRRRALPPRHPLVAESLYDLAALQLAKGAEPVGLARADSLCRESLAVRSRALGEDAVEVAASLEQLAEILHLRYNLSAAESLQVRAISIFRKAAKDHSPQLIRSYQSLAEIVNDRNRPAEAESLYRQAVIVARTCYPGDHPEVAKALGSLGGFMGEAGNQRAADSLAVEVLGMQRRMWGDRHPSVAEALIKLGNSRIDEGRLVEAESLLSEAYRINQEVFGDGSAGVAEARSNLGNVQWTMGKNDEAETNYRAALAIWRKQGGETWQLGMALDDLALVLHTVGRNDEARELQLEALGMLERVWGPEHTQVALCNSNISTVLMEQGKYDQAEPYIQRAISIWSHIYGNNPHPMVAVSENNYGYLLQGLDRLPEAEAQFRKAVAAYGALGGGQDWGQLQATYVTNLGICLYYERRLAEAEDALRQADTHFRGSLGERHPRYGWMLTHLGAAMIDRGSFSNGDSLLHVSLGLLNPKAEATWMAWAQTALAASAAQQGHQALADSLFRVAGSKAWSDMSIPPAARRIAKERQERYFSSGRAPAPVTQSRHHT